MFYGLWRSIDEIKSLEGVDVLWIEEAHNLTEAQWKVPEATIRKQGSQIWIVFNPKLATDFAYKRFVVNPPPNTVVRRINYDENPFLSETMRQVIKAAKAEDYEDYEHIYLGVPKQDDEGRDHQAVVDHGRGGCAQAPSASTSRVGAGSASTWPTAAPTSAPTSTPTARAASGRIRWKAGGRLPNRAPAPTWPHASAAPPVYDSIGVGAAAGAAVRRAQQGQPERAPRHPQQVQRREAVWRPEAEYSQGIRNKDMFANIKAQAWWLVADGFRNTFNAVRNGHQFDKRSDQHLVGNAQPGAAHRRVVDAEEGLRTSSAASRSRARRTSPSAGSHRSTWPTLSSCSLRPP